MRSGDETHSGESIIEKTILLLSKLFHAAPCCWKEKIGGKTFTGKKSDKLGLGRTKVQVNGNRQVLEKLDIIFQGYFRNHTCDTK